MELLPVIMLTGQKGKEAAGNVQRVFILYINVNESFHHLKNVAICVISYG
jgi:hypothetical protein